MIYKLNGEPINIHAQHTIIVDGVEITYPPGSLLLRRDEWAELGIEELPDPAPVQTADDINELILRQIAKLEQQQARPLRELSLDPAATFPRQKLASLDTEIATLRAGLVK